MSEPNALQRLILDRKAEKDWTYAEIAQRGDMSKATVYKLATSDLDGLPRSTTMAALAKGLGLPERVVREAAVRATSTVTYTEDMNDWEKVVVGHSRELSEDQRRQVMALIEAMLGE